jgi:hypothetical protein
MTDIIQFLATLDLSGLAQAGLASIAAGIAFLGALYAFFLLIPGEQPDKAIKALLDLTQKLSRK